MEQKPIIFCVDDDPQILRAIQRDLRSEFRREYRVKNTSSAREALTALEELKKKGETVALFLSDQRIPEMLGVEFLELAKRFYPTAKRVLLTAYSDTDAAIKAINDVQLDYYLLKPWDPPEEKLFPVLKDLLDDWWAQYTPEFRGVRLIGYQYSPKSHEIKDFLAGNLIPYEWIEYENTERAAPFVERHSFDATHLPVLVTEGGEALLKPTVQEVARKLGMSLTASEKPYDVVIIGAGPAGLAAGVYGGSEGRVTALIERCAPSGQAGTSSRIENYLGFPNGLSGADLARRAITQATRFGIEFLSPTEVSSIERVNPYNILKLKEGGELKARAVVVTTGVNYRKLSAPGMDRFTGAGIYYGAATTEASACQDGDVYIAGGGNSAGQGAVYLSKFARKVHICIRREDLTSSMSQYLIDQIDGIENIEVLSKTEVIEAHGDDRLEALTIKNIESEATEKVSARALFVFIGARPYTDWLSADFKRDSKGFLLTGNSLMNHESFKREWLLQRDPFTLETSVPGVFAAGDVRSGAMNRVASAVGEGAMSISLVHQYLSEN
ncbi:MAG: FAD-dependent oxidoreductase [Flavobacteriales bacterium]|nr:FAD-dependent oxidoreductase [Flavobacteriales bacterium]